MTWEQKLLAIKAISPNVSLAMRWPENWYLMDDVEIGGDGGLRSWTSNSKSPEHAVEEWWMEHVTTLPNTMYIVLNAGCDNRRHVRWNGAAWADLTTRKLHGNQ